MTGWCFFGEHRLVHQAALLARQGHADFMDPCQQLVERLPALFGQYRPHPALLHGDLWGGNWAALADHRPAIFDPASYYGDRETDLAMTELFGGFSSGFYQAYEAAYPLDPGYPRRRPLYQLYHVMNHAHLFGGGYLAQSRSLLRRLLEETR